jgi:hypothetical protein
MIVLHIFTEEPSAKNVFEALLPKLLPDGVYFRVYPHQGKQDLEQALKKALPQISRIPGSRILITRDQDQSDCREVKSKIANLVNETCACPYAIRILCKELEAWFLGDLEAVEKAYPRFKAAQHIGKADLREVDKIVAPNKFLLKIIPEYAGRDNLPKLETSDNIAPFMNIESNSSQSFNHTIGAIKNLISIA